MNFKRYYDEANETCFKVAMNYLYNINLDYIESNIIVDNDISKFAKLNKDMKDDLQKLKDQVSYSYRSKRHVSEKDIDGVKELYKLKMKEISEKYQDLLINITGIMM